MEAATGQPLVAKPKTLAVVYEHFQRRRRSVAEHENLAAERIVLEHRFANLSQAINALPLMRNSA